MQSSYWGYWLIVFGVAIVGFSISVQGLTTNTNQNYLSTKEIAEASLLESVDYGYYRDYNEVKINKEKFMEVFLRMIAETMSASDQYEINFYGLYEAPPKVSVEVKSNSGTDFVSSDYDTVNRVDAIIQVHAEEVTTNSPIGSNTNQNEGSGSNGAGSNSSSTGNNNDSNSSNNNGTSSGSGNSSNGNLNGSGNTNSNGTGNTGSNTGSNNTGNNNSNSSGTGSSNNTGTNTGNNTGSSNNDVCKNGIKTTLLKGIQGTAMISSKIYESAEFKKATGTAKPGVKFDILGENADADKWAVSYDGKCGWVQNKDMAINMAKYIPEASFQILNASSSMYKSSGKSIPGLTGKKLYSSEYSNSWVPGTFSFAKKLKRAAVSAKNAGDTIVIYDAYRPKSVSTYANNKLGALYNSDKTVKANIDKDSKGNTWGKGWFLAQNVSMHNIGCAVDASLRGGDTPTAMHELSTWAIKYEKPNSKTYSTAFQKSTTAKKLSNYMMNAGLGDLASEWWHYQDNSCSISKSSPADFWKNV